MIQELRQGIAETLSEVIRELTGVDIPAAEVPVEDPPRPEMGDLACPVALQLARETGRKPRELGEALAAALCEREVAGVAGWSVAGPGFLNITLRRGEVLFGLLAGLGQQRPAREERVLVEHTSINPNKAAHIGHLRNSCLGDTLARVFVRQGHPVEVHNYIDDTGVQVADVVIGFIDLREMTADEVAVLPEPFDYLCWDVYTEVSRLLAADERMQERRRETLRALEGREGPEAAMAQVVVRRIVGRHILTMRRLGIEYDLLVREGDILALDLWAEAFDRLRQHGAAVRVEEGKHAGCWVMPLSDAEGFEHLEEADKVLVRSNGVATYVAKDIAYHLWKYGLLDRGFHYEVVEGLESIAGHEPHEVWQTTCDDGVERAFGDAGRAVSVIDVRQSYLQSIVGRAFFMVGEPAAGETFTHFAYEMVALSPRTARDLGIAVEEGEERSFVEMSGRRGYGVKADDLLDELERRATEEVSRRNPELGASERRTLGRQIAVGAARYFLLKYARNTVIVFDLDDALSFEGETGPYLQYAAVRAARIFDRLREQAGIDVAAVVEAAGSGTWEARGTIEARLDADDGELWGLILALTRLDEIVDHSVRSLEISVLAKYAFNLAQAFNRFYHGYPIIQAADAEDRALRILVAHAFRRRLASVLQLLGIPLPARM